MSWARAIPQPSYRNVTLLFLAAAAAALVVADLAVTSSHPGADLLRLVGGFLKPEIAALDLRALASTLAFAVLGVGFGAVGGLALAFVFPRSGTVRAVCAFLRSIHELFWALLLMQVLGLGPLTGILAVGLPYMGIFAKVYSELIEEADLAAVRVLPVRTDVVSAFFYARLPDIAQQLGHYTLYRLECGLRSTLVLGFIGLPTIGFDLDSYFKQGAYAAVATLLISFYLLIGTRRLWARPSTVPLLVVFSFLALPEGTPTQHAWQNLTRFLTRDIVPLPLRNGIADLDAWRQVGDWVQSVTWTQILPGLAKTLVVSQLALVGSAFLALVLFPWTCRRFAGRFGRPLGRALLVVVRSTPDYMVAYVLLQILGPSMLPAVLALTLHNGGVIGYLMGRQADALPYRLDAPRGLNLYAYETVPRLYGQFLAYCLYRWEIIVRESAIFGILGVATLGFYVDAAISELRLDTALLLIVATAVMSLLIDVASRRLRAALRVESLPVRLSAD